MFEMIVRNLAPLAWAFAILLGVGVLLTPEGPVPVIIKLLALLSIASGASAFVTKDSPAKG
jgi:hypothetical protein